MSGNLNAPIAALSPMARPAAHRASKAIRVQLVDDHPVVRKGIALCLARHQNLEIIGEAADGNDALRKARELHPDLVLMDIDMPNMSGLTVTEILRKESPQV